MDKGTGKEKVPIVGCKIDMIDKCVACSRCLKAFNDRNDEFAGLSPSAELIGLLDCGSVSSYTYTIFSHFNILNDIFR